MEFNIDSIAFSYTDDPVLIDVSMELKDSEMIGILGPNGSGKTTFMKCLNRLLTPSCGRMLFNSSDVLKMSHIQIARIMGYVPQNNANDMSFPTVYEVVMMGRRPYGSWKMNSDDEEIVWNALKEMDVDDLALHRFNELSSGQVQRVLMARAIAQEAKILLLDEPTSNLDIKYQIDVMNTVRGLARTKGIGVCAIIHDLELAMKYCDKIVLLHEGRVLAAGPPLDVITPDNIRKVYGIDIIIDHNYGAPHIIIP